ncbi:hypothetical protein N007_12130 [Alicyclobacillus acidoterrestris ATCC 49025]|nr:hypothetical protein N007_12130 [Alicyclobacillus acidoterrestris ATCC 49025]
MKVTVKLKAAPVNIAGMPLWLFSLHIEFQK